MGGKKLWSATIRILLSLGLIFCMYLVTTRAVAYWYFIQFHPQDLRNAIAWDPGNPEYYATLGRILQRSVTQSDPDEVIHLFKTATRLSPYSARYWADLGGAFDWVGREDEARKAYDRARDLFPNSPEINWQLGNFYLRDGELEQAFQAFQKTLLGDPSLRRQTYDLAWRASQDAKLILDSLIPPDTKITIQYLHYLSSQNRMEAADEVWSHLLALGSPFEPKAAFPYLDALITHHKVEELVAAWEVLTKRHPNLIRGDRLGDNVLTNGNFENHIVNGGLGWRVTPIRSVVVQVDSLIFFNGTHSLRLEFDGQRNISYGHIYQYVPVHPNTSYSFVGYLRAKDITTNSGPHLEIYDAYDTSRLSVTTDNVLGTSSWSPYRLEFRTGPETHLVVLRLARRPSRKLDNQIAGTLWIDRLSLQAIK